MIIGLGSGICGTHSLATVLRLTHEKKIMSWVVDKERFEITYPKLLKKERKGDVAFFWLPYTQLLLAKDPSTKFVCLRRDKEQVVSAFYNKVIARGGNRWVHHEEVVGKWIPHNWDHCYPNYPSNLDPKDAIAQYYDDYYKIAATWETSHPQNFKIFNTKEVLNTRVGQQEMLNFCNLDQEVTLGVRRNVNNYGGIQ